MIHATRNEKLYGARNWRRRATILIAALLATTPLSAHAVSLNTSGQTSVGAGSSTGIGIGSNTGAGVGIGGTHIGVGSNTNAGTDLGIGSRTSTNTSTGIGIRGSSSSDVDTSNRVGTTITDLDASAENDIENRLKNRTSLSTGLESRSGVQVRDPLTDPSIQTGVKSSGTVKTY